MDTTYSYPKLRWPLDIAMQQNGAGEKALVLRCPLGLVQTPLVLIPDVAPLVVMFDGAHSFQNILDKFSSQGLSEEILKALIVELDNSLFIANSRFYSASKEMKDSYRILDFRSPALAGGAYPSEAINLQALVDGYLSASPFLVSDSLPEPSLLIAPHIDYRRGGKCYGEVYPYLTSSTADLYIVIGTSHQYSKNLFHLTKKNFNYPLGTLRSDVDFVSELAAQYGEERSFEDEYLHKQEHSLELQLPFLGVLKPDSIIAPILVGSFHEMVSSKRAPENFEPYEAFVTSLARIIKNYTEHGKRVAFIAGVDMTHVGREFGDEFELTPEYMEIVRRRDYEYLAAIESGNKSALFEHICEDGDARRICGFPTLYTILDLYSRLGITLKSSALFYDQAVDVPRGCAVTYAGLALHEINLKQIP